MSELRWILLVVGLVLLIGIYLYSRRSSHTSAEPAVRREPRIAVDDEPSSGPARLRAAEPVAEATTHATPPLYDQTDLPLPPADDAEARVSQGGGDPDKEKVVAIHVAAKGGRRFRGPDVVNALETESLEYGELGIYHRRTGNRAVFSVSSMVEPGHFDPATIEEYTTPGLSFFMIMPGPDSPVATFTEMLSTARRVATVIDGEVLDESGSTLSRQAASHMREQIIEFAHRVR